MDHGLVCKSIPLSLRSRCKGSEVLISLDADYYLVEFGNEALKLAAAQRQAKQTNGHANGNGNGNGHVNGH